MKLHDMVEFAISKKPIIFDIYIDKKVNISQRSTTLVRFLKSSIFIRLTWNLKRICISGHWIQPPIIFEVSIGQKDNKGRISEIVNFHPIDLKFEENLYFRSLNSISKLFLRSNLFYGFCRYRALHDISLFVCLSVNHLQGTIINWSS